MSLLFADGFDWLPSSSVSTALQTKYSTVGGSPQRTTSRLSSGFGVYIPSNQIVTTFPNQSRVYIGAAVKLRFAPQRIFSIKNPSGTEQCYLYVDSINQIQLVGPSTISTNVFLSNDAWNYVELGVDFKGSTSDNDWWIRLNGIIISSGTGDISSTATPNCGGVALYDQQFDDFYVTNDSGTASDNFRGFLGPISIRTLFPIGSGIQLNHKNEKNTVSPLNYASVSGSYDGDSSYVEGSGNATTDLYTLQDLSDNYSFINGLMVTSHARFVDSPFGYYNHMLSDSTQSNTNFPGSGNIGTSYWATSHNLSKSFITSSNWNVTEVNDLQIGTRMVVD